jgi:hypothetical protein
LDYTVSSSGNAISGSGSGTALLALSPGNIHALSLTTATPGAKTGTISASSTSQEVAGGSFSQPVATTVLAHATPSFTGVSQSTTLSLDFGVRAMGLTPPTLPFSVLNLADASGYTAGLDLDSITSTGDATTLATTLATFTNHAAGAANGYSASLDTTSTGSFSATYTLATSDQNLPGAAARASLSLQLHAIVALAGDANLDGSVNVADLGALATNYGLTSGATWAEGDFDRNGTVDVADLGALATNYGMTANGATATVNAATIAASTAIPEPATFALMACALALALRRGDRATNTH